jgi:hypothetical protein
MPLNIGTKEVNNLSGPVSMYILYPSEKYLKRFPYAPILILFGDQHRSDIGYCDSKNIINGDYKIFDIEFLELLSKAVYVNDEAKDEIKETIDFYVEGGDLHLSPRLNESDPFPMPQLCNLFTRCYNNSRMPERSILDQDASKCSSIKNIRWQSGDIRFFQEEVDKCHLWDFLTANINFALSQKGNTEENFKAMLRDTMLSSENDKPDEHNASEPNKCKSELLNDITAEATYELYINQRGLIRKQLDKGSFDGESRKYIEGRFKQYIDFVYKNYFNEETELFNTIHKIIIELFNMKLYENGSEENIDKLWNYFNNGSLSRYTYFLMIRKSLMLDLYTLARSYKIMNKNIDSNDNTVVRPLVTICYFGSEHISDMYSFLARMENTDKFLEYVPYFIKHYSKKDDRCVNFDKLNIKTETGLKNELDLKKLFGLLINHRREYENRHKKT